MGLPGGERGEQTSLQQTVKTALLRTFTSTLAKYGMVSHAYDKLVLGCLELGCPTDL